MKNSYLKHIPVLIAMLLATLSASAKLRIEVTDSLNKSGIPFVAVFVEGTGEGLLTDENGRADLYSKNEGKKLKLRFSVMGYEGKKVTVPAGASKISVKMSPVGVKLKEVTVKNKRKKYSKKNNPAVDFAVKIRKGGDAINPKLTHDNYNYNRYERITLGLNKFDPKSFNHGLLSGKFDFLSQHVDTSDVSGQPVLIVSVKEKGSEVKFRRNPKSEKEVITAIHREGLDDITDEESVQVFLEDIMREVDLYNNDITLMQYRFVSPLSRIAPDFYKFFLTDTVEIDGEKCIELSFTPHNTASLGFSGHVYVPQGDSTMFIKRVDMHIPPGINLNFVEHFYLKQEYERAPDGSRLKTRDDMTAELSVLPGVKGLYIRRNTRYDNHNFDSIPNQEIFKTLGREIIAENAYNRDDSVFTSGGFAPRTVNENRIGLFVSRMRSVPIYYWGEKVLKVLFSGYLPTNIDAKKSKFDFGPVNTIISGNKIEGTRLRIGGMTTANLFHNVFAQGYVAYGTRDRVWKYSGELDYSFNKKKYHSREFPVHSLRLTHTYDMDQLGQHYLFTNKDNFVLAIKRKSDVLMTYHRVTQLKYTYELRNNFSITASIDHERQEATEYVPFTNGFGQSFNHFQETTATITLRYAPGEKLFQTKKRRISINFDAPKITLTHSFGPKNFLGNTFAINKTELTLQKRFWFSAFGYTDVVLKGGHVWQQAPFTNLLIPNANLSYIIQPESYTLMNPMEFINDSYASWDITYWANGSIFNYIPLIKKLKLREVFCFRGLTGKLSQDNNPVYNDDLYRFPKEAKTTDMNWKPYMEVSAGVDNILKCIRLDYVWRLSYLNAPNINKSGLRLAMHFTF